MSGCVGCIMTKKKCIVVYLADEYIPKCPCLKCLVKITCDFDTSCKEYESFMEDFYADEKYEKRIMEYEERYNGTL